MLLDAPARAGVLEQIEFDYVAAAARAAHHRRPEVFALADYVHRSGGDLVGDVIGPLRAQYDAVEPMALPRCEVAPGTIEGRAGTLLTQGAEFLAEAELSEAG